MSEHLTPEAAAQNNAEASQSEPTIYGIGSLACRYGLGVPHGAHQGWSGSTEPLYND